MKTLNWRFHFGIVCLLLSLNEPAYAQQAQPILMVVPYAAGGGTDAAARIISEKMSRSLSRTIVVENVAGAGGTIGTERVARSQPGSAILINHTALVAAPSLFPIRFDTEKDLEPIGLVNTSPMVLVARRSIPGSTPAELLSWVKAHGAEATFAHGGLGTNNHLCAEIFGKALGFAPRLIAYRGGAPALTDLISGSVDLFCDQLATSIPQIQANSVRGIAVTSAERSELMPSIPTTMELGVPGVRVDLWHGLYVAKGTPPALIKSLNAALIEATADPTVKLRFQEMGAVVFAPAEMTPEAHKRKFDAELKRIGDLMRTLDLKAIKAN